MKKFLSLLVFVLCVALNANAQSSGTFGENNALSWSVKDGVLTISGEGAVPYYAEEGQASWSSLSGSITSIVIEDGVTAIGDYAFAGLQEAVSVSIPASVKRLGWFSFGACTSLSEIHWYETSFEGFTYEGEIDDATLVTDVFADITIGVITLFHTVGADVSAFSGFKMAQFGEGNDLAWTLVDGTLSIKGAGSTAFSYLSAWDGYRTKITKVDLDGVAAEYSSPYVLSEDGTCIYFACTNGKAVTLPDGVKVIGEKAFYGLGLMSLVVPSSVNRIDDNAFNKCSDITSVTVYPSVAPTLGTTVFDSRIKRKSAELLVKNAEIEDYATWATYFKTVTKEHDTNGTLGTNGSWNFESSTLTLEGSSTDEYTTTNMPWKSWLGSVTKIVVGDGVESIGKNAFYGSSAKTIVISDDVKEIGDYAFYGSTSAKDVTVGSSVTTIGKKAFASSDAAVFTFGNNPSMSSDAIEGTATKNLVIAESYVNNHFTADDLMLNTNTYNKVIVNREFPENTLGTASNAPSGTIILPFAYNNLNNADFKFYKLSAFNASTAVIQFEEVIRLEANTPYLWRNFGDAVSEIVVEGDISLDAGVMSGNLASVEVDGWQMFGVYAETRVEPSTGQGVNSDLWYYTSTGGFVNRKDYLMLAPYRAYFYGPKFSDLSSSSQNLAAELRSLSIEYVDIDGTTSIENVTIDGDGRIDFSQQDGVYYDLSGRRVDNPTSGIYIVNGKKVLVK